MWFYGEDKNIRKLGVIDDLSLLIIKEMMNHKCRKK